MISISIRWKSSQRGCEPSTHVHSIHTILCLAVSQGECRVWPSRGEGSAHRIARCRRHLLWKLQDHPGLEICEYPWLIWFTDPPATSKVRGWWSGGRCGAAPSFHLCFSYVWPSDSCHGQCSDFDLHKGRIFKNTSRRDKFLPGWKLETNWKLWGCFLWGNIIMNMTQDSGA